MVVSNVSCKHRGFTWLIVKTNGVVLKSLNYFLMFAADGLECR